MTKTRKIILAAPIIAVILAGGASVETAIAQNTGAQTAQESKLDINKDGELDVRELTQSRLVPRGGRHR